MGLFSWIRKRHDEMDDEAVEDADEMSDQTDEERDYTGGDPEGLAADHQAARIMGANSMDDIERLGNH